MSSAALALLLSAPVAQAGACCTGNMSALPTQVGECERGTLGVGVLFESTQARWDSSGRLAPASVQEEAWQLTGAGAIRLNRQWQLGASVPIRVNHLAAGETQVWGGGPGDAVVSALWDPMEEGQRAVPLVTLAVRVPTGTSPAEAHGALFQDVTGLAGPALTLTAAADRTLGKVPWNVGVRVEGSKRPAVSGSASVGLYVGNAWTVSAGVTHLRRWSPAPGGWGHTHTTDASVRVITGAPVAWRAWVQGGAGVPLPGAGHSAPIRVLASTGVVKVF